MTAVTIDLGKIKFNWKGAYDPAVTYDVDDVVQSLTSQSTVSASLSINSCLKLVKSLLIVPSSVKRWKSKAVVKGKVAFQW